jgi:hypothetical protein
VPCDLWFVRCSLPFRPRRGISTGMAHSAVHDSKPGHRGDPNFLTVVLMSAVALLLAFAAALLIVWFAGRHLLPNPHAQPVTALYLGAPGAAG